MTYLDAVNQVLRRLREPTVASINQTTYSSLIGILLNDAKAEVESAWNWSGLRNTITVTTASGVSADGDTLMEFYPKPSGVETIRINYISRDKEFTEVTDTYTTPARPITLLAYAKAVEERGEDGGVGAGPAFAIAALSLSDAIQLDAQKHPEETIWEAV